MKKFPEELELKSYEESYMLEETVTYTPATYFNHLKDSMTEETPNNLKSLYNVTMAKLQKYMVTGQKAAAKRLFALCKSLEKEYHLVEKGVTQYVLRSDIEKYIEEVANKNVVIIELENYDRDIPDEIVDKMTSIKGIVDRFYVVFTDYTGETRSIVEKERIEKDPILFANILIDGKLSPKFYVVGDWVDEYCDLTLDSMLQELAKVNGDNKEDYVYNIENISEELSNVDKELHNAAFGKTPERY